jgi:MFS transporter, DHA2 family, multidrug resistance protein
MGVSLSQTVLARREQFHQERLSENVGSWNPFYYDTLNQIEAISERTRSSEVLPAQAWRMSGRWSNRKRRFLLISTSSLRSR